MRGLGLGRFTMIVVMTVLACNEIVGFGDFEKVNRVAPSVVANEAGATDGGSVGRPSIFLGAKHSCAVFEDATMRCWGLNDFGQLGVGDIDNRSTPTHVEIRDVTFLSLGERHTCVTTGDGSVLCWGSNENGQLGIGPPDSQPHHTPVRVEAAAKAKKVQAGKGHTCTETISKAIECWGANQHGQLGDGTTAPKSLPTRVPSLTGVAKVSTGGGDHTCAVARNGDAAGDAVFCWGLNDKGQLGQPPQTTASSAVPLRVEGVLDPDKVFTGKEHSCAALPDTTVSCWGANQNGQLGDGTLATRSTPALVKGVIAMPELGAGFAHTCGTEQSAAVGKCWGSNQYGQLGTGTAGGNIAEPQALPLAGWEGVTAKGEHACGRREGISYCWGRNEFGQLGNGSTTDTATPTPVRY